MRLSSGAEAAWTWESSEEDKGRNVAPAPATTTKTATGPSTSSESDVDRRGLAWPFFRTIADCVCARQESADVGREGDHRPLPITGSINVGDGDGITSGKQTTAIRIERGGTGTEEVSYPRVQRGRRGTLTIFYFLIYFSPSVVLLFFPCFAFTTLAAYKSWSRTVFSSY